MLVQDHLREQQAQVDPRTEVAPWQQGPSQTSAPHNYFHEAHLHKPETRMIADDFWRGHGNPKEMTDVHVLRYNKHLVDEGLGNDAFQIHKKVPVDHQDKAIEHLTRPFAPRRDLNFVPAHMFRIPEHLKPQSRTDFTALANVMSRMHYTPEEIEFRLADEWNDLQRRRAGGPPGTF